MATRSRGIEEGLRKVAPNAVIVAKALGLTTDDGMKITENFLQAHPSIKVIVTYTDAVALGAMEAVKGAGKATDDFAIFGTDATPQALAKIKEGSILRGTVDFDSKNIPRMTLDIIFRHAKGEKVPKGTLIMPKVVDISNVDQYIK